MVSKHTDKLKEALEINDLWHVFNGCASECEKNIVRNATMILEVINEYFDENDIVVAKFFRSTGENGKVKLTMEIPTNALHPRY